MSSISLCYREKQLKGSVIPMRTCKRISFVVTKYDTIMSHARSKAITAKHRRIFTCFSKAFLTLNAIEVHSNKMINDVIPINLENYEFLPTIALIKGRVRK